MEAFATSAQPLVTVPYLDFVWKLVCLHVYLKQCSVLLCVCVSDGIKALWEDFVSGSKKRRNLLVNRYGRKMLLSNLTGILSDEWINDNTKNCPHCFVKIQVFISLHITTYWHSIT